MSKNHSHEEQHEGKSTRREMSRRQFLSYTLGGSGAFMFAGMLIPMLRFAVDPILQPKVATEFVKVVEESAITSNPQSFSFNIFQVDAWYESEPELSAWIYRENGRIIALSPVCKHLGCTVDWNTGNNNQFICPCHGAHYTKAGKNLNIAPLPLDEYEVQVENGWVYLGQIIPNTIV